MRGVVGPDSPLGLDLPLGPDSSLAIAPALPEHVSAHDQVADEVVVKGQGN